MPGLLDSRWRSSTNHSKDKDSNDHVAVPSFGFTMPVFTPIKKLPRKEVSALPPTPLPSSYAEKDPVKKLAIVSELPSQQLMSPKVKNECKPQSKADIAAATARDRLEEILGQRRKRILPSTATEAVGNGLSMSYGGYAKVEFQKEHFELWWHSEV
ncbi:uncharacterized protein K460DRAFT_410145 [Cucurbitaria berberidis CBS 394.84]|uniref:Uncharacterized protein n=1 Tax=Cucurbitaria berberidis CBS 394.84 TaxID=1168544 RepID=A0A9P4G890_9PLEO|nr:uncharacterized protein K460DRAFT_410145 [Cucurbitaria berberidis CBS 394.84]KAF1840731.1 hypothetical protein K460DRAFT_410145 [Cucurbitaria berberidis CBS 394.84]